MQSATTSKEDKMIRTATDLYRRLTILGVTAAVFATIVPVASAGTGFSDERLKDEVEPVADAVERLRSLRTV